MYKVLIVDDEMIVRVGLKSFIEWKTYGFTLCGEANNGDEALALCEQLRPHLVLTDIRMPKRDGISFIDQALKRWPGLKIIVLSCVNEFDVLQQALRYGVKDYFLKLSFNPEHLIGILERIREELDQQPASERAAMLAQEAPYPEQAVLKENFYRIAVRDKHQSLKLEPSIKLQICKGEHIVMLIRGDHPYSRQKSAPKLLGHLLKYSVINIVEEVLVRETPTDAVELNEDCYLVVFNVHDDWNQETSLLLAKEIQQSFLRFLNYSVSIGISKPMNGFCNFYTCYSQSITALEQKFYRGHGLIHFYDDNQAIREPKSALLPSLVKENEIADNLETFSFEKVRSNVLSCLEQVRSDGVWPSGEFKAAFIGWVIPWLQLYKKYGAAVKDAPMQPVSPFEEIHELETLDDLQNWYLDFTIHLEEMIRQAFKGVRERDEIQKAKRYIETNYFRDISIVDVAAHIGLNSTYFSHLFKKENGQGFTDYLTRHRLMEAQRLLKETAKTISEISEEVGYNDVTYFRKIFRQQLQMTPSEYRAQFI